MCPATGNVRSISGSIFWSKGGAGKVHIMDTGKDGASGIFFLFFCLDGSEMVLPL